MIPYDTSRSVTDAVDRAGSFDYVLSAQARCGTAASVEHLNVNVCTFSLVRQETHLDEI